MSNGYYWRDPEHYKHGQITRFIAAVDHKNHVVWGIGKTEDEAQDDAEREYLTKSDKVEFGVISFADIAFSRIEDSYGDGESLYEFLVMSDKRRINERPGVAAYQQELF